MWLADKIVDCFAQPVVAAGRFLLCIHSLLDHAPLARWREQECVVIQLKTVLHGGRIDLRAHPRGVDEAITLVNGEAIGRGGDLVGRPAARRPFSARNDDSQVGSEEFVCLFERPAGDGGDARTVPIETKYATERLEPPRVGQPPQHLAWSELVDDGHRHGPGQPRHPPKQPRRSLPAVQRQICKTALHGGVYGRVATADKMPAAMANGLTSSVTLRRREPPQCAAEHGEGTETKDAPCPVCEGVEEIAIAADGDLSDLVKDRIADDDGQDPQAVSQADDPASAPTGGRSEN